MKNLICWITSFVCLLLSNNVWSAPRSLNSAESCQLQGQKYSEVLFTVTGSPGIYQDIHVVNQGGNQRYQTLWYTEGYNKDTDYIFNEPNLKQDVKYQILFINEQSGNNGESVAQYYRKNLSAGNQYWQLIEEKAASIKSGQLTVTTEGGNISDLKCFSTDSDPIIPEIEIDICSYVPDSALTNLYANGKPSGGLNISTNGNFIYLPDANSNLSFKTVNQPPNSNNCNYSGGQISCNIDPDLTFANFPPALSGYDTSNSSIYSDYTCPNDCEIPPGKYRNITLKMNGVLTLQSGVYFFNELNFSEQNTQIKVKDNKPVEIHYKKIYFASDNVKLNEGGIADNFLLIGEGIDSAMNVTGQNAYINGYVFIDPVAVSGLVLSQGNTKITGGVAAASLNIISGSNNIIGQANAGQCLGTPVEGNYVLVLSPQSDVALTCESMSPTVSVFSDGQLANDFTGTVVISVNGVSESHSVSNGSFIEPISLLSGG